MCVCLRVCVEVGVGWEWVGGWGVSGLKITLFSANTEGSNVGKLLRRENLNLISFS